MPKKKIDTAVEDAAVNATPQQVITLTKEELRALVASEVAAQSLSRQQSDAAPSESGRLADALDAIRENQKAIVEQANQRHRTVADMMAEDPRISAFNPKGDRDYPRPTHFRKVNGVPRVCRINGVTQAEHIDRMKAEEIAAWDAFTESVSARNKTWHVRVFQNGNQEYVDLILPTADMDKRQEIGSMGLVNILYELRTQGKIRPDVTTELNKWLVEAPDASAFLANLKNLLLQGQPVAA